MKKILLYFVLGLGLLLIAVACREVADSDVANQSLEELGGGSASEIVTKWDVARWDGAPWN